MPIVILNELHLCQLRLVVGSENFEVEINASGEIVSWVSPDHPSVPTQAELDAAEAQLVADPTICEAFGFGQASHLPVELVPGSDPRLTLDFGAQDLNLDLSDLDQALLDIANLGSVTHPPAQLGITSDPGLIFNPATQTFTLDIEDLRTEVADNDTRLNNQQSQITANDGDIAQLQADLHDPITLSAASDPALVLNGQELTLTLPPDIDFAPVTLGAGSDPALTLSGQELTLDLTGIETAIQANDIDIANLQNEVADNDADIAQLVADLHDPVDLDPGSDPALTLVGQTLDLDLSGIQTQIDGNDTDITALQAALHDPITLAAGSSGALTLVGQELSLTLPVDMDFDPVTLAVGSDPALTLNNQELDLDLSGIQTQITANDTEIAANDADILALQNALHDPITLGAGSDPALAIVDQVLTLTLPPDIDHDEVTLAVGSDPALTLNNQELDLDLSPLTDDITQNTTDIANLSTSNHAAITLGASSDPALAIVGQELTLTLPPDIDHDEVTLAAGSDPNLTLTGQELDLDLSPLTDDIAQNTTDIAANDADITALQAALHDPVTLATGSDAALTLTGQELSLTLPPDIDHPAVSIGPNSLDQLQINAATQVLELDCTDLLAEAHNCTQLSFPAFPPVVTPLNVDLYTHVGIINEGFGRDYRFFWNATQGRWVSTWWKEYWTRNDATVANGVGGRLAINGDQGSAGVNHRGTTDPDIGLELLELVALSKTQTFTDITVQRLNARDNTFKDEFVLNRTHSSAAGGTTWILDLADVPVEIDDVGYIFQKSAGPNLDDLTLVATVAYRSTL